MILNGLFGSLRVIGDNHVAMWFLPRSSDENSICLSVCPSVKRVHCDKTKEKCVQIFTPFERSFSLVFWEGEWLVGATFLPEILGQPALIEAKSHILIR